MKNYSLVRCLFFRFYRGRKEEEEEEEKEKEEEEKEEENGGDASFVYMRRSITPTRICLLLSHGSLRRSLRFASLRFGGSSTVSL